VILRVCEASAIFCAWRERQQAESSRVQDADAHEPGRQLSRTEDSPVPATPKEKVETFITKMQPLSGKKITRKDIWIVAGYSDATEFERFQRDDPRTTRGAKTKFGRVLKMDPAKFLAQLQEKKRP
jgi:hypothetical protein